MATAPARTPGLRVGKLFGAPVILNPATLIVIAVLAFVWAPVGTGQITSEGLVRGAVFGVLLFASVFLHEVAHAATAQAFGRRVDEIALTLFGGHTRFDGTKMTPGVSGVVAAAGPLTNVVLGLAGYLALKVGVPDSIHDYVHWVMLANLLLAVFNALPGLPLDGGQVTAAIVWRISGKRSLGTVVAAWIGRAVAVAVPSYLLWSASRDGRVDALEVMWDLFILMLLWGGASAALNQEKARNRVATATVATMMRKAVAVPFTVSVADAVAKAEGAAAMYVVVLSNDGAVAGYFPLTTAAEVPAARRAETSLDAVTQPLPRGAEIPKDSEGQDLALHLREWFGKTELLVVMDWAEPVGILRLAEAVEHLQGKKRAVPPA